MKMAQVYVMENRDGILKVGFSAHPERRRQVLGVSRLLYASASCRNPRQIERLAHRQLKRQGKHVGNEWFSATFEEAKSAIEEAERMVAADPSVGLGATYLLQVRIDNKTTLALDELRQLYGDRPTKSEAIRRAILSEFNRLRKEKGRK